ncbi:mechanosensitive ion channel domain-containing protein [Bradyrhizobium cenepequi]|uniref:mechanosensitive ion channel domain-containing protein n=1 Tax=Bradyrhizobium cenepequi TaxID=2821403 RepID=UPI001CE2D7BF|nr:mechanosensitive ion channel domain-containing protein [Bradyrhizobium cenepequi]MCA6106314.1 mechanosensitive ion channel [Bradyrhizobium cenepequi]
MPSKYLRLLTIALAFLLLTAPARSQMMLPNTSPPPAPPTSAQQAQATLDILQDDQKRAQLIQTLQTIAKASSSPAPAQPTASSAFADNLGVQLLAQVSDWFGDVSDQLATAARAVSDFPMIWRWLVNLTTNPYMQQMLLDTVWRLALVIACAFMAEWIIRRAIRRPLAALDHYIPLHARHADVAQDASASTATETQPVRRWHSTLTYVYQLAIRFPFALARLFLDLLPVACFAAIGNLLLATDIGREATPRVVILAMVNAYVIYRSILAVTEAVISPASSQPSLFIIRDEAAAYLDIWWRRIVAFTVFGIAVANIALLLGLYRPAYHAVVRLLMLVVHLFVVVIILQCRRSVADWIRAPEGARGPLVVMRNRFADVWHILAIVLDLALWTVWALRVQNGYALLFRYFIASLAVLLIARLASLAMMAALDRVFRISPEFTRQFPGLEARANRYFPALRSIVSGVISVITVIALLEVWGLDAAEWFSSDHIGGRLLSALITVAIAGVVALAIWEAVNAAVDQHLLQLSREGRYARAARLRTFLPMLRTTLLSIILTVVALTALSQLGVNIAPLLAGAGIVGIAIGFGSQKLVQDVITGLFLLLENAMQVGDFVTVSGLSGVVENLSIRTIRLRAGDGSVHIIPFSSVTSVTNTNRGIGNASVSVNVDFREDPDRVGAVLKEIGAELRKDPAFQHMIRGDLDLWGVDKVDATMTTLVGQIQCTDSGRWPVQREFYRRMKKRFQELNIQIARPPQTMLVLQSPFERKDEPRGAEAAE